VERRYACKNHLHTFFKLSFVIHVYHILIFITARAVYDVIGQNGPIGNIPAFESTVLADTLTSKGSGNIKYKL
jgi:hypothetical protein